MTATSDETALIHAIRLHPAEDTPRLAYADWLDENAGGDVCGSCAGFAVTNGVRKVRDRVYHRTRTVCPTCSGTGRVSDGRRERAEFIRVQIGIAQVERDRAAYLNDETDWQQCTGVSADWCPNCGNCQCPDREDRMDDPGCPLHRPGSPHDGLDMLSYRERRLADRATALWREWSRRWFGQGVGTDNFGSALTPNEVDPRVRRGFVAEVRMPLTAFLDAAKGLFTTHPIERVVLTDRDPDSFRDGSQWFWYVEDLVPDDIANRAVLPVPLWRLLAPAQPPTEFVARGYYTRDEAMAALSTACVAYGRDLAGLPPLIS